MAQKNLSIVSCPTCGAEYIVRKPMWFEKGVGILIYDNAMGGLERHTDFKGKTFNCSYCHNAIDVE